MRRSWMLFVDGENFTLRAQAIVTQEAIKLPEGDCYLPDVFVWLPKTLPTRLPRAFEVDAPMKLEDSAIRAHYYTSVTGDEKKIAETKEALWRLGFHPEVFKKPADKDKKAKGVDIALTKDLLSHAFLNNYDVAVLMAGDGDYIPLVTEVKRLGKLVYVAFFETSGLNPELRLASDWFCAMERPFLDAWKELLGCDLFLLDMAWFPPFPSGFPPQSETT